MPLSLMPAPPAPPAAAAAKLTKVKKGKGKNGVAKLKKQRARLKMPRPVLDPAIAAAQEAGIKRAKEKAAAKKEAEQLKREQEEEKAVVSRRNKALQTAARFPGYNPNWDLPEDEWLGEEELAVPEEVEETWEEYD